MFIIFNRQDNNSDVTEYYINMIIDSILRIGQEYKEVKNLNEISKGDIVITISILDLLKIRIVKKDIKTINWYQGILPEESFMRNRSILRKCILDYIERWSIYNVDLNIFVSRAMMNHYNNKHGYSKKNYLIIPCFNTEFSVSFFNNFDKYKKLNLAYIGSISKWQCFEEMLDIFKEIEKNQREANLYIFTREKATAEKIIINKKIKHYYIDYVPNDQLARKLNNIKYGFLLRKNNAVNYVSTPTKMSHYIANGVIPIMTNAIGDFKEVFKGIKYKIIIDLKEDNKKNANKILNYNKLFSFKPVEIYNEYHKIFNNYYSREKSIIKLSKKLEKLL